MAFGFILGVWPSKLQLGQQESQPLSEPILILSALPAPALAAARGRFDAMIAPELANDIDGIAQAAEKHGARALIIGGRPRMNAAAFDRLPDTVRIVATTGVGFDHIDTAAAAARGVTVSNTPDVVTGATADMALFLMLGALRRGREYLKVMDDGWRRRINFDEMLGMDAGGRTLGIVGMGRIGRAVAYRAKAFGMKIAYHNRNRLAPDLEAGAVYYDSLDALLPHTQVLSLNAPAAGREPLVQARHIALLPRGAVIVNTGRGALIDEEAMIEALKSGHLAAAGLDVFASEPDYDLRLRDLPNVFMAPHMGSATLETRIAMSLRALENVERVLSGLPARDAVTA